MVFFLFSLQIVYIINLITISIMGTIDLKCNVYCASALLVHLTIHRWESWRNKIDDQNRLQKKTKENENNQRIF
jgi:hypothetical protein